MLRAHNYSSHVTSNPHQDFFSADCSDEGSHQPLIPKELPEREVAYTRRVYSGIHSAANMTNEVVVEKVIERKVSHGRGGAGNLRRPSEGQIVEKTVDGEGNVRWRRASVWSQSDEKAAESRRASIVKLVGGFFGGKDRKGSVASVGSTEKGNRNSVGNVAILDVGEGTLENAE